MRQQTLGTRIERLSKELASVARKYDQIDVLTADAKLTGDGYDILRRVDRCIAEIHYVQREIRGY